MPRAFDLRLELRGIEPTVWRLLRVPGNLRLDDLHHSIQVLMGWEDRHLYVFDVAGKEYGPRREDEEEVDDLSWAGESSRLTIADALDEAGGSIEYVYDFGDEWRIGITSAAETRTEAAVPVECLAGERAGPPEHCGGPHEYQKVVDAWPRDGARRSRPEVGVYLPKRFDPNVFDIAAANEGLRELFRENASAEFPAGPGAPPEQQLLANLTLLVLFLGSAETRHGGRHAWKTVRFEILETLQEAGLLYTDPRRKSVIISEAGVKHATALLNRITPSLQSKPVSEA